MATGARATKKAAPTRGKVPLTFAAMKDKIRRPQRPVPLVMDTEAAGEIEALELLLEYTQRQDEASGRAPVAPEIAKRLTEVEDAAHASVADVVLQAIPHTAYQKLRKEHPPTAEQLADVPVGERGPAFDPDTFCQALVLAQLQSPPPPDPAEWQEFWDQLSDGQMNQLWTTALAVQMQALQLGPRSQNAAAVLRELGLPD